MIEQKTLLCLFEQCECQNDEDGCVVGMAGGPVHHALPTLLLISVEESIQFNLNVVLLANIVKCMHLLLKNHISHIRIMVNPHKIL